MVATFILLNVVVALPTSPSQPESALFPTSRPTWRNDISAQVDPPAQYREKKESNRKKRAFVPIEKK